MPDDTRHPTSLHTPTRSHVRHTGDLEHLMTPARLILTVTLIAGGAIRVWLALNDDGVYWPDEVYQSLEPAHWLVFGYGLIPWEFVDGMRNWAFPGFVAALLKICQVAGIDDPRIYITVVKVVFGAISLACAAGTYMLARSYAAGRTEAAAGAALCALLAPLVYFAPRAMSESASALPVILGFALALSPAAGRARTVAGAALVGVSVLFRLQAGVFAVALVVILLARRKTGRALESLATLAAFALLFGWLDHLTWADVPGTRFDGWFHSAFTYLQFNLIEGNAANWGTSPWHYYFTTLWSAAPLAMLLTVGLVIVSWRSATGLLVTTVIFVALHVAVPHKELRFIVPALPLLCALVAIGLTALPSDRMRTALVAAVLVAASLSGARFHTLTYADVGMYPDRATESAYDDPGPVNRLLLVARDRPGLCGVRVDAVHVAWSGGHTYLHRQVPIFNADKAPLDSGWVSHVIAREGAELPGDVVAREGEVVLVELPSRPCVWPPGYLWRL